MDNGDLHPPKQVIKVGLAPTHRYAVSEQTRRHAWRLLAMATQKVAAISLLSAASACGALFVDPYPMPDGPVDTEHVAVVVDSTASMTVLYLTPRPGDVIELVSVEPIGLTGHADVAFHASRPIETQPGEWTFGLILDDVEGASITHDSALDRQQNTVAVVAVITPREPGRFILSELRLRFRLNGGDEQVRTGISTAFTVCAAAPQPASCEE